MLSKKSFILVSCLAVIITITTLYNEIINAHCDSMDGPVVSACKKSLETGNINFTLIWVQEKDEKIVKEAFNKTLQVRKLGEDAKELADMNFFETVVRVHRSGEGEPYDGLKPAGTDLGLAIPAGDKAIENGSLKDVENLLIDEMKKGLSSRFNEVMEKKNYDPNDVKAGREFVKVYVNYIHYVEAVYESAAKLPEEHTGHEKHGH